MYIGGASSYLAPAASLLPARSASASVSPAVSPDLTRAAQAPATPSQSLRDEQSASAREEADQPTEQSANGRGNTNPSPQQQRTEQLQIAELVSRDQEVRAHEQAHSAVGGRYAGAPSYTYTRGPDGKRYAVGGEVGIDVGPVPNDPQATLRKMEIVLRAALAPAEPSAQDLRVAAQAQAQIVQARADLAELQRSAAEQQRAERAAQSEPDEEPAPVDESQESTAQAQPSTPNLDLYRQLGERQAAAPLIDLRA